MLRKVLLSAAALSMVAGAAAFAQEAADTEQPAMERGGDFRRGALSRLDANGDGSIQQDEFTAAHTGRLAEADADGDGVLSQEELEDYVVQREIERRARHAAMRLDIDGDGEVTLQEIEQHQGKLFALMDRDSDGALSVEEMRRGRHFARGGFGGHHRFKRGGDRDRHGFMMMMPGGMGHGMMQPNDEAEGDEE